MSFVFHSDIALIRLPTAVENNDVIHPIDIKCGAIDKNVQVAGMGNGARWSQDQETPRNLRYIVMETVSLLSCFIKFNPAVALRSDVLCAEGQQEQGICFGDSGGPLFEAKSQSLVGIASFGSPYWVCDWGMPSVFTKVSQFVGWINKITGIKCVNQ